MFPEKKYPEPARDVFCLSAFEKEQILEFYLFQEHSRHVTAQKFNLVEMVLRDFLKKNNLVALKKRMIKVKKSPQAKREVEEIRRAALGIIEKEKEKDEVVQTYERVRSLSQTSNAFPNLNKSKIRAILAERKVVVNDAGRPFGSHSNNGRGEL